jgi:hypothetical protein
MKLDFFYNFFLAHKIIIINIAVAIIVIVGFLFFKKMEDDNPINKVLAKVANFLFLPYPKSTGWVGRLFINAINDPVITIINQLFYKMHNEKFIIIIATETWEWLFNYVLEDGKNLTTAIYKNYGILIIKNHEEKFLDAVFNQLSSYDPWPQKIFINYGVNINYEQFQKQISNVFKKNFDQLMDLSVVYNCDHARNSFFDSNQGINYDYLWKTDNVLEESYHNGFLMANYKENSQWAQSLQDIGGSIQEVVLMNPAIEDGGFLEFHGQKKPSFKKKNYLKFWNKFYIILLLLMAVGASIQGVLDFLEYKKISQVIGSGKKIIKSADSFQEAQTFLNALGTLNTKKITLGQDQGHLMDKFFAQVYNSSIFNVYEKKINILMEEIQGDKNKFFQLKPINQEKIQDINYIILWKSFISKIQEVNKLIQEFNEIFNTKNPHNIQELRKKIKIYDEENYIHLEKIKTFIGQIQGEIQSIAQEMLQLMADFILNDHLMAVKNQLWNTLKFLTAHYSDKNSSMGLDILRQLLQQLQNFLNEIQRDIYQVLDGNQWHWPFIIQGDINFLKDNNLMDDEAIDTTINEKFLIYKQQLWQWQKTFVATSNVFGSRHQLLNHGDTTFIAMEKSLSSILSSEIVQVMENNRFNGWEPVEYENKMIVWDLEKVQIIVTIANLYKDFLDQWNGLANNGFLLTVRKITDYNINQLFRWMINDGFSVEKLNMNSYKAQYHNLESTFKMIKTIKLKNFFSMDHPWKTLLIYQTDTLGKMFLNIFNNMWFAQINGQQWDGEKDILTAIIGITDVVTLTNLFSNNFQNMDAILTNDILPFMKLIMEQTIIEEENFPYCINQLTDISTQLVLYKNGQDNDLKTLEKQIIGYSTLKNYDLFKMAIKDGFSNGNVFLMTANNLHNILVSKAQVFVQKKQMKDYNSLVKFFNDKCYGKIPLVFKSKQALSLEDVKQLKKLWDQCGPCRHIFEKNPLKYKEHIQWLNDLGEFFNSIEILSTGIAIKYDMTLQSPEAGHINNNLIMRWYTNLANKETSNKLQLNGVITNSDKWELLVDIVNDSSISVVELDKIVPLNRGCLIFSSENWGFWKFINQYLFKETSEDFILQIKIPIILRQNSIQQQWIITYVKIKKLPSVTTKGPLWQ